MPVSRLAAREATLPSARSLASITTHWRSRSPLSREMLRVCSVSFKFVPLKSQILAGPMGFEPTTSDVTGRRSNRAELRPRPNHLLLHFPAAVATTLRERVCPNFKEGDLRPLRFCGGLFWTGRYTLQTERSGIPSADTVEAKSSRRRPRRR